MEVGDHGLNMDHVLYLVMAVFNTESVNVITRHQSMADVHVKDLTDGKEDVLMTVVQVRIKLCELHALIANKI